uniref:Ig-like domain-containing protein n=1 Tax=Monodelphis domestica TaxID=13616 RepID=F7G214_MONDO
METISPSGAFLSKFLICFFFFLEMSMQASGDFSVIGPNEPFQTSVGGEAVLSCYLSPSQSAQNMEVIWSKSENKVHLYQNGNDNFEEQAPSYQGRTELVKDAISSGNVTLKILDVKPSDEGQYKCFFNDYSHAAEAFVELKVIEAPTLFQAYPAWWSVIGILALGQLSILFYYSWRTYQHRGNSLLGRYMGQGNQQRISSSIY